MTPEVHLRPAVDSDLQDIRELEQEVGLTVWPLGDYSSILTCPDFAFVVAEKAGTIVGFYLSHQIGAELELLKIGIYRLWQNRGIGQKLLDDCLRRGVEAGCLCCFLEVRSHNLPAIRFYRRNRFELIQVRRKYYQLPEDDALVLRKDLNQR